MIKRAERFFVTWVIYCNGFV